MFHNSLLLRFLEAVIPFETSHQLPAFQKQNNSVKGETDLICKDIKSEDNEK